MHKEWLEFAAMDLDSAQFLLGMRPVPVEIICYHCEQAAEKLLKAVLVAADVDLVADRQRLLGVDRWKRTVSKRQTARALEAACRNLINCF